MAIDVIRRAARRRGYEIRRSPGMHPYVDLAALLADTRRPVVFDVGAHIGDTIRDVFSFVAGATVHAFEPSKKNFARLYQRYGGNPLVRLNNIALGDVPGTLPLNENAIDSMGSLLPPGKEWFGKLESVQQVPVSTLSDYCAKQGIQTIDLLKTDTEGYDLNVFKGAGDLFPTGIRFVHLEIPFTEYYEGAPQLHDIHAFMLGHGYVTYAIYPCHIVNGRAGYTNATYVHRR